MKEKHIPIKNLVENKVIIRDYDSGEFVLDLQELKLIEQELYESFLYSPKAQISAFKYALGEYFNFKEKDLKVTPLNFKLRKFHGIHNISELRVEDLNKLVRVEGMVSKVTKVLAIIEDRLYSCKRCGSEILVRKGQPVCSCGGKTFSIVNETIQNIQELELEETQDKIGSKQPHKIRVRLLDDLTDKDFSGILQPGNKIEVIGIVEKIEADKKEELYEYRVLAIDFASLDEMFSSEKITDEDLITIKEIAINKPLEQLSQSLAPSIYGYDYIKKALVLQMVGGVKRKKLSGTDSRDRIHILLCGDPGMAKSQLAKNLHLRMPKSYYVSGDESTKAGLVAVVDRDVLTGQWSLKAGALSKANDSILVIDELDKLSEDDRNALHTPMESGEIIVNKADIHTTISANCSILAVANPKEGMFELEGNKTITNQINLPSPLLSRFDLIFVMVDEANDSLDESIIKSILGKEESVIKLDISLFRKYISYAKTIKPSLKDDALEILTAFYKKVRRQSISTDSKMKGMPITPRHLEGIIRIAEASAKLRLSDFVEKEDILLAQDIFYKALIKLGLDESGVIDLARIGSGTTLSKKKKGRMIVELLIQELEKYKTTHIFDNKLKELCVEKGIPNFEYDDLIYELNKEGEIIKIDNGWGRG